MHNVYLLECRDGSYYCGITKDLQKRIAAHNNGSGARYTASHGPVKLAYFERKRTLSSAMKREIEIKKLPRKKKIEMAENFKEKFTF